MFCVQHVEIISHLLLDSLAMLRQVHGDFVTIRPNLFWFPMPVYTTPTLFTSLKIFLLIWDELDLQQHL
jgi:hypothetical protein